MKILDPIQYLTGFIMGVFFGFFTEGILLILFGLFYRWFGRGHIELAWWMLFLLIPIPSCLGLITGKTIARLHLEDY